MRTIPFSGWIANAAARLNGGRGAVTRRAEEADCSRQTVYTHARKVIAAVEAECGVEGTREELIEQLESSLKENAQLWELLDQTIEFSPAKQQEFAVTAMALGLSSSQIRQLMVILLGPKESPSRSTIHRWIQAAGAAATRVLEQLDRRCRELVLIGSLDEIFFHGRPVLVGVEPHSMVWFLGACPNNAVPVGL
jgi:AcrR family transcriptional regulator